MNDDKNYDDPESLGSDKDGSDDPQKRADEPGEENINPDSDETTGSKKTDESVDDPVSKKETESTGSDESSDEENLEEDLEPELNAETGKSENQSKEDPQEPEQENVEDEPAKDESKEEKVPLKERVIEYYQKRKTKYLIWALIFLFFFILFLPRIVVFVEAGEAAVLFKRFQDGVVIGTTYGEGVHLIYPWDHMAVYNVRYQNFRDNFDVLSNDGLTVNVQFEMRYRPVYSTLSILHREVGPNYAEKIVQPEVRAVIREVFGQYLPSEIYGSEKFIIENTVQGAIAKVGQRFVTLDNLMIKKIKLPIVVETAIEQKLRQEQRSQEFQYRIEREVQEAERKRIEAQGIRDFQNLITEGITEEYLRFKGIEATLELAKSNNSKIIMIGGGEGGLPVILDATTRGGTESITGGANGVNMSDREEYFRAVDSAEREPGDPIETFYDDRGLTSGESRVSSDSTSTDPDDVIGYRRDEMIERESHLDVPRNDSLTFKDSRYQPNTKVPESSFRDSRGNIRIPFRNNQNSGKEQNTGSSQNSGSDQGSN